MTHPKETPSQTAKNHTSNHDGCLGAQIGNAIERIRRERPRLTQRDLALRAGVSRRELQLIEQGKTHKYSVGIVEKILTSLRLDFRELAGRVSSPNEGYLVQGILKGHFILTYPEEGLRFISLTPKQQAFFFGLFSLEGKKTIDQSRLPRADCVVFQGFRGKLLFRYQGTDYLLSEDKHLFFGGGACPEEVYNPDQMREAQCLLLTVPGFVLK